MKAYFAFKDCKRSFREKEKLLIPGGSKIVLILIPNVHCYFIVYLEFLYEFDTGYAFNNNIRLTKPDQLL